MKNNKILNLIISTGNNLYYNNKTREIPAILAITTCLYHNIFLGLAATGFYLLFRNSINKLKNKQEQDFEIQTEKENLENLLSAIEPKKIKKTNKL